MSTYFARDLQTFDDGELDIGDDINVAGARQSQRQLVINLLQTTRGNWRTMPRFGWGGEHYVGRPNNPLTHRLMMDDLNVSVSHVDDIDALDVEVAISVLDGPSNTAIIVLRHAGTFIEEDGYTPTDTLALGWEYSYRTGEIVPLES